MTTDTAADEMVTMRRADLEELRKFYGDELARRREVIMATIGAAWARGGYMPSPEDVAELRVVADRIIEAAR